MSQLQDRIAQFRKMASEDPENELGHFRLGQLLMEAEEYSEAAACFARTLELNPLFSKVYQLLGECQIKQEQKDAAIATLTKGYGVADERGDKMPRDAMGKMLTELGAPVPAAATPNPDLDGPETGFHCKRPGCPSGKRARPLASPPIPDTIGQRIHADICASCWDAWFKDYSIKVINELRLDLSSDFGQKEYDKYMREFLGFEDEAPAAS
jgi:tetratricopeptide (TPR) repeat protein